MPLSSSMEAMYYLILYRAGTSGPLLRASRMGAVAGVYGYSVCQSLGIDSALRKKRG